MARILIRDLPAGVRVGLTGLLLVLLIGMAASAAHLYFFYHNRDESPQFTLDDVRAAYHGLDRPPALQTALERGHPETLKKEQRDVLLKWVRSGRITEDYDSIDLGPASPSEIIASSCVSCHAVRSPDPKAAAIRLASLENIKKVAFGKKVNPNPVNIVAMSTHAHALSLSTLSIVLCAMLWMTRLPRSLAGALIAITGLALLADVASWWIARSAEGAVYVIVGAGAAYNGATVLAAVLAILDLWWPASARAAAPVSRPQSPPI